MFKGMEFQERMEFVLSEPYRSLLQQYDLPVGFLEAGGVAEAAANFTHNAASLLAYSELENDFFFLHLVTSSRSLRMSLLRMDKLRIQEEVLRYFWRGIIVVYICRVLDKETL